MEGLVTGLPSPAPFNLLGSLLHLSIIAKVTARIKKITNLPLRLIEAISKAPTNFGTRISSRILTPQQHFLGRLGLAFTFFTTPIHSLLYFPFPHTQHASILARLNLLDPAIEFALVPPTRLPPRIHKTLFPGHRNRVALCHPRVLIVAAD